MKSVIALENAVFAGSALLDRADRGGRTSDCGSRLSIRFAQTPGNLTTDPIEQPSTDLGGGLRRDRVHPATGVVASVHSTDLPQRRPDARAPGTSTFIMTSSASFSIWKLSSIASGPGTASTAAGSTL
jgi:hypothetical protein